MTSPYNRRGAIDLKPDDHALWACVQKRVAQRWSWEQIAAEIGCKVDDLIHWANWVYQPPKKTPVAKIDPRAIERVPASEMPTLADTNDARRFLAWKKAQEGARMTREAMKA